MILRRLKRKKWLAASVFLALLMGFTIVSRSRGVSLAFMVGALTQPQLDGEGEVVVATVNDEPVTWHELESTKNLMQLGNPAMSDDEAYQTAFDKLVRTKVQYQEAIQRGYSAGEQEAWRLLRETKAMVEQSPEAQQMLQDRAQAMGLTSEELDRQLVEEYKQFIPIGKLTRAISAEAPRPTEEEIDVYLARQPGPNALVLIPIHFDDVETAHQVYEELQALRDIQDSEQFVTTFDGYARRLGNRGEFEFVHETFQFASEDELPDYAQDAVGKPEGSLTLFERADGTSVIYLVLKSSRVGVAEAREQARQHLTEEKRAAYVEEYVDTLVSQADVRIFYDRLPPGLPPLN